jgi:hypothetical protein
MKDLIRHIIKEETNKSVKLIRKYYDIEGDGANYRGDNVIHTLVAFFPKDYDDEMTPDNVHLFVIGNLMMIIILYINTCLYPVLILSPLWIILGKRKILKNIFWVYIEGKPRSLFLDLKRGNLKT